VRSSTGRTALARRERVPADLPVLRYPVRLHGHGRGRWGTSPVDLGSLAAGVDPERSEGPYRCGKLAMWSPPP